jgi:hypothetical protein
VVPRIEWNTVKGGRRCPPTVDEWLTVELSSYRSSPCRYWRARTFAGCSPFSREFGASVDVSGRKVPVIADFQPRFVARWFIVFTLSAPSRLISPYN